jgi:hypothetical protein
MDRRRFLALAGAGAGAAVLAGCGSSGGEGASTTTVDDATKNDLAFSRFFAPGTLVAGSENRVAIGLADADGLLDDIPARLTVQLADFKGNAVADPVEVIRRSDGVPRPYYRLVFTIDEPGDYVANATYKGQVVQTTIPVTDPAEVTVIQPGTMLPAVATPTVTDGRGVTPICTAEPQCRLHDVTLAQALTEGQPIGLLVATPKFCQVSVCGPVLDVLLAATAAHPGVRFLHAEVYPDPEKDLNVTTEIVGALGLSFEPTLILAGADGKIVERLDNVFDRTELAEALARLA